MAPLSNCCVVHLRWPAVYAIGHFEIAHREFMWPAKRIYPDLMAEQPCVIGLTRTTSMATIETAINLNMPAKQTKPIQVLPH
jgi:hypothetical protein